MHRSQVKNFRFRVIFKEIHSLIFGDCLTILISGPPPRLLIEKSPKPSYFFFLKGWKLRGFSTALGWFQGMKKLLLALSPLWSHFIWTAFLCRKGLWSVTFRYLSFFRSPSRTGQFGVVALELGTRPGILEAHVVWEWNWELLLALSKLPGARTGIYTARPHPESVNQQGIGQSSSLEGRG